jgi:N-acetylglucosamine transport system substrate-binding protein
MYTDKIIEAYARLNGGAVMATVNALDMARPHITEGVYGMFGAFTEPGAAALIFGFASPPEGTRIDYMAEIFNPLSDVMTGRMTARQWAENIDQAMQDMAAGL